MVYRGRVENGVIHLEDRQTLPEGAVVEVHFPTQKASGDKEKYPSLCEGLKDLVGKAEGLPPDASLNIDHYLYGVPKRQ